MEMMAMNPLNLNPIDAMLVFATNYITSMIKNFCKDIQLPSWGARINPFLPFIVAFALCFLYTQRFGKSAECAMRIGTYAMITWNVWKTTVQGR